MFNIINFLRMRFLKAFLNFALLRGRNRLPRLFFLLALTVFVFTIAKMSVCSLQPSVCGYEEEVEVKGCMFERYNYECGCTGPGKRGASIGFLFNAQQNGSAKVCIDVRYRGFQEPTVPYQNTSLDLPLCYTHNEQSMLHPNSIDRLCASAG